MLEAAAAAAAMAAAWKGFPAAIAAAGPEAAAADDIWRRCAKGLRVPAENREDGEEGEFVARAGERSDWCGGCNGTAAEGLALLARPPWRPPPPPFVSARIFPGDVSLGKRLW